ncbi:spermatogenesis-associated protein 7 [Rhynchocyon petersi]
MDGSRRGKRPLFRGDRCLAPAPPAGPRFASVIPSGSGSGSWTGPALPDRLMSHVLWPERCRELPRCGAVAASLSGAQIRGLAPPLPRCGPPCLFTGHLSTKSNAFCTDSSSLRLSTLHLVKSHMAAHYNKILSAKAVVDCSVPLSMSSSIKYADQQRREKLKKELAQCEKELRLAKTTVPANSQTKSKSSFNSLQKPSGEPQEEADVMIEELSEFPSFTRSAVFPSEKLLLGPSRSDKVFRHGTEKTSSSSRSSVADTASRPRKSSSGPTRGREPRSSFPHPHRFRLALSKASSGDLLDKHSELFSNKQLPFTPRTLKTDAKSYLSQYRYYTPARRKKDPPTEAATRTEVSSFTSDFERAETENLTDSEVNIKQTPTCLTHDTKDKMTPSPSLESSTAWDEIGGGILQCSSSSEEELLYLSFIEDITDEILKLGLFSNRFLERLFERHIKENRHHLEEGKMRHLLDVLKGNLGILSEQNSVQLHDVDMWSLYDLETTEKSKQNALKNAQEITIEQERQDYKKALDMLLSAQRDENDMLSSPNDFSMPISKPKKCSEEVLIQQVNEDTDVGSSTWDRKNPGAADNSDQETCVKVIEDDSDSEKAETSNELACLSLSCSQPVVSSRDTDINHDDMKGPTLQILDMSIGSHLNT